MRGYCARSAHLSLSLSLSLSLHRQVRWRPSGRPRSTTPRWMWRTCCRICIALQEMEQVVVFYNPAATATSTHHTIAAPLPLIPFPPFLSAYLTSFTILQLQQRLQQHQRQQEHNSDAGAAELAPDHQRRRIGMRPANEIVNFFRRFPVQKRTVRAITLTYTLALARTFPAKSRPVCFTCVPTRT